MRCQDDNTCKAAVHLNSSSLECKLYTESRLTTVVTIALVTAITLVAPIARVTASVAALLVARLSVSICAWDVALGVLSG